MDRVPCDIYACRQPALFDKTVTAVINGETTVLEVCDDHREFFLATPPENYLIGRTFTGEVEVRPVPKQPAPQAQRPE